MLQGALHVPVHSASKGACSSTVVEIEQPIVTRIFCNFKTLDRFKLSWLCTAADIWNGLPVNLILQGLAGILYWRSTVATAYALDLYCMSMRFISYSKNRDERWPAHWESCHLKYIIILGVLFIAAYRLPFTFYHSVASLPHDFYSPAYS